MGIDADFYLKGKWTDSQKTDFEESAKERGFWDEYTDLKDYGDHLNYRSLSRYYGPGYERGYWPYIRATFMLLKHHFPDAVLLYGGDSDIEDCEEVTDEFVAKMDAYWLSENGQNYRKYWKAQQRETTAKQIEVISDELEIIAREILEDEQPPEIGQWEIYENGNYRVPTGMEKMLYERGWGRKKNQDAFIVRTNGFSDERNK
jgi:hypothetical protein